MIAFLTSADTEILTLSRVVHELPPEVPGVRAANASSPAAVELAEAAATAVIMHLLGGQRPFEPAFSAIRDSCLARGVPFVACAGDSVFDPELADLSTVPLDTVRQVFAYLCQGGAVNLRNMLLLLAGLPAGPPQELPWFGVYERQGTAQSGPAVAVLFYRAHWMSGNTEFVDALCERLERYGCSTVPIFVYSLKPENAAQIEPLLRQAGVAAIVNTLSFASGSVDWLRELDVPVLQAIVSTSSEAEWRGAQSGLSPLDTAMNVALPEFDGSIITVPVSFKQELSQAETLGSPVVRYAPQAERVDAFARLTTKWAALRAKPNAQKRVAFVLSNYPTKNARLGNAVGLDTPASLLAILRAMGQAGYVVGELPDAGDELIFRLIDRCSNDREFLTEQQL
ncbi:MAG TPA: cobaltochelatase subunit CobN, partial [Chloroflexota bacterium]